MGLLMNSKTPYTGDLKDLPDGVLNYYPGARWAFWLARLNTAYTGPAIRLRRASDNVELDFGFRGLNLDIDAMEAWAANTDAYLSRVYDQAGSGVYLGQSTNVGYQPKLIASGQTLMKNGRPAALFDGVNDRMGFVDAEAMKAKAGAHLFTVAQTDEPGIAPANARVLVSVPSDSGSARVNITDEAQTAGQISASARAASGDNATTASIARTSGALMLVTGRYDFAGGAVGISINGGDEVVTALSPAPGTTTNTTTAFETRVGCNNGAAPSNFFLGSWVGSVLYEAVNPKAAGINALLKARHGL